MKLLLIEDNIKLQTELTNFLKEEGYLTETANDFRSGIEKIHLYKYDLVIVDIGLPDGSGFDIIRSLKSNNNNCGILIISAKNAIQDKVNGLELGADDYITKPFHIAEFNARIKSILRRKNFDGNQSIGFQELNIDLNSTEVKVGKNILALTKKEYELLLYLLYNKDRILTKESIAEHLWGDHIDSADSFDFIYSHIKNLRRKIITAGGNDYIKSVYGMGYKLTSNGGTAN
ncbi:MAG: response regulator transcription factor [Bacteroidetes bacterium]|nr:response regulator transcription factor [Bacteroidota bacterium]